MYSSKSKSNINYVRFFIFGLVTIISLISLLKLQVSLTKPKFSYEIELKTGTNDVLPVEEPYVPSIKFKEACFVVNNPRTSSIFAANLLNYYGSEYILHTRTTINGCEKLRREVNSLEMPLVKLSFQKEVAEHLKRLKVVDNALVIIQGDEYCRFPARQIFDSKVQVTQYYDERSWLFYIPIGPRREIFEYFKESNRDFGERKYFFNFIGSLTNQDRYVLKDIIESSNQFAGLPYFTKFLEKWNDNQSFIEPTQFAAILADSTFTLCPNGHNPETFRFFEALEANSIPIVAKSEKYASHPCENSLKPYLEVSRPFVVVLDDWNELPSTLERLRKNPEEIERLQSNLEAFRTNFWRAKGRLLDCILSKNCHADPRNLLITGCGRSGTFSIQQFLTSVGVDSVHEGFRQGAVAVSWLYAVQDESYPFEYPIQRKRRLAFERQLGSKEIFSEVVLLVRNPLKVISSIRRCFCGTGSRISKIGAKSEKKSWQFIERHLKIPQGLGYDSVERAMLYWLHWNRKVLQRWPKAQVLRLETATPQSVLQMIGRRNSTVLPKQIAANQLHVSKRKVREDVTWQQLMQVNEELAKKIANLAISLGYNVTV